VGELLAEGMIRAAVKSDVQAARELADRTEGKASQHLEATGDDGGPVEATSAIEKLGC
jgi:hypothetical protein